MTTPTAPDAAADEREALKEEQIRQAEELLFSGPHVEGFGKSLFRGRCAADWVFPYPQLSAEQDAALQEALTELRAFCDAELDPEEIDRQADIPRSVIDGLARVGVLGMTAPANFGGRAFPQQAYCKLLEEIGSRCSSTSIFVNAHHSIGMRALLLFGTEAQQERWLRPLARGETLAAFALTEVEAGSDAANVQTTAEPSADGSHFVLNGAKRYITNGGIADVLTVMARTPVPGRDDTAVTAFLVTPDMPGFEVVEARMDKLGIRGTATARLAFHDMVVPRENILGPLGKGLKVALTVLDFGRTTFGACCTGAAKTCLRLATEHAARRRQFGRSLGEFDLVRAKLARMAATTYALEAMTTVTAGLIDRGLEDFMLETAMLKVWSTEVLWTTINDAFQIHGGAAYFSDNPFGRILRDGRINQIGEGANEVLTSFIGLVGMRGPGEDMRAIAESKPLAMIGKGFGFLAQQIGRRFSSPAVPVRSPRLSGHAKRLGRLIGRFGLAVDRTLIKYREDVLERQLPQERIAVAAMELFASACTLSRRDAELSGSDGGRTEDGVAELFLDLSARKIKSALAGLKDHDDDALLRAAPTT